MLGMAVIPRQMVEMPELKINTGGTPKDLSMILTKLTMAVSMTGGFRPEKNCRAS
jgi:hypothetical protein